MEEWKTYRHRDDAAVRYGARKVEDGYEVRTPAGRELGVLDAAFFEAVYEEEDDA